MYIYIKYLYALLYATRVYSSACQQRPIALRVGAYKSAKVTWVFLLPQHQHYPSIKSKFRWVCKKCKAMRWQTHWHTLAHTVCLLQSNAKAHKWITKPKNAVDASPVGWILWPPAADAPTIKLKLLPTCNIHAATTFGVVARCLWRWRWLRWLRRWNWRRNIYKN